MGRNWRRGVKKADLPHHPLNFFPNKKEEKEVDLLFFTDKNLEIESSCEIIARANKTASQPVTLYTGRPGQPDFPREEGQAPLKVNILAGEKPWLKGASGSHLWRNPKPTHEPWNDPAKTHHEEGTSSKWRDPATLWDMPWTDPAHQTDLTGAPTRGSNLAAKMATATASPQLPQQTRHTAPTPGKPRQGLTDEPRITPRPTVIHMAKRPPTWPNQRYRNRLGDHYQAPDKNTGEGSQTGASPFPHTGTPQELEDQPWEAPPNYWHTPVAETPLAPPRTPPHTM